MQEIIYGDNVLNPLNKINKTTDKEYNMAITLTKGNWYDKNGNIIPEENRSDIRDSVNNELDRELHDNGFQGFIKRIVKKQINK